MSDVGYIPCLHMAFRIPTHACCCRLTTIDQLRLGYVQRHSQPKIWTGAKYLDLTQAKLFGLEHLLSKHKTTRYVRNLGGMAPLATPVVLDAQRS